MLVLKGIGGAQGVRVVKGGRVYTHVRSGDSRDVLRGGMRGCNGGSMGKLYLSFRSCHHVVIFGINEFDKVVDYIVQANCRPFWIFEVLIEGMIESRNIFSES